MYSISGYGNMIADKVRVDAYTLALRQAIKPGSVVVDIGAGTGFFSMLACRLGAGKVYAIEPDDAIHVARELAIANGYADRIEFFQDFSSRIELPEPADVIISDMRGVLPLFQQHLPSIVDARQRLLKPEGILIPQQDTLWAAVVEAPDQYGSIVSGYRENQTEFRMDAARRLVTNTFIKTRVNPDRLLTPPLHWATLAYTTMVDSNLAAELSWTLARAGTAHGLILWFDATLAEGTGFSNAPSSPELVYGSTFFPFSTPVTLGVDDTVHCALHADLVGDDYVWRWETRVLDQGRADAMKASFKQSTLLGVPLSLSRLRKRADSFKPCLQEDGRIDAFILGRMAAGEGDSLGAIARQVAERFPARFKSWKDALAQVGDLSQQYSG